MVEVGARAPTSHPSTSPLGIIIDRFTERELGRSVFRDRDTRALTAMYRFLSRGLFGRVPWRLARSDRVGKLRYGCTSLAYVCLRRLRALDTV